jgi:hypothetical protein
MSNDNRKHSSKIVDGVEQAPSRAMLRAVEIEDEDFNKQFLINFYDVNYKNPFNT